MRRWVASAPVVFVVAGCFGDNTDSETSARAHYVRQANAICREWDARRAALGPMPSGGAPSYDRYVGQSQAIAREEGSRIMALHTPKSLQPLKEEWREARRTLRRQSKSVERATARLKADLRRKRLSGPIVERHLAELHRAELAALAKTERIKPLFRRMGLDDCASL